jgi:hypothetical protein
MANFVPASQVSPNIIQALRTLRQTVEMNAHCTQRIKENVSNLLLVIYMLLVHDPYENPRFTVPQQNAFSREMNRIHRWVVQWSNRGPIDEAMDTVSRVFEDTVAWYQERDRYEGVVQYVNSAHEIYENDYMNGDSDNENNENNQQQQPV